MLFPTSLVGSYPQPDWLIDRARLAGRFPPRVRARELWRVDPAYLEEAQRDATVLAIRAQEEAGLDILTDGEIRRESYSNRFATALDGVDIDNPGIALDRSGHPNPVPRVTGPVRRRRPVEVEDLKFLRANTSRTIKITVPGPFTMAQQAQDDYYGSTESLALGYAEVVGEEVQDLFAAGADIVQLDEPYLQARPEHDRLAGHQQPEPGITKRRTIRRREYSARRRAESFPLGRPGAHNDAVTYGQVGAVCPQCGSAAAVHSVEELAAMARTQLGESPPGYPPPPGYPAAASGFPEAPLGYPAGPPPESWQGPGPPPGYTGQQRPSRRSSSGGTGDGSSFEDDLAGIALTAATRFIGRAIGRRVKRTYNERVVPTMADKQEAMLREQIAIAERHPDLRACLTDQVVFLAGGSRVLPMAGLIGRLTLDQSDALVAQLRDG